MICPTGPTSEYHIRLAPRIRAFVGDRAPANTRPFFAGEKLALGMAVDREQRSSQRREESALLVVDRVIEVHHEIDQGPPCVACMRGDEIVRIGLTDHGDQGAKSTVAPLNPSPRLLRRRLPLI